MVYKLTQPFARYALIHARHSLPINIHTLNMANISWEFWADRDEIILDDCG